MRNARMARARILKWVASGVMLALLFAIVFAGTLSGAFGIENALQNSGVIENNVADAGYSEDIISVSMAGKHFYSNDAFTKKWSEMTDGSVTSSTTKNATATWQYRNSSGNKKDGTITYSTHGASYKPNSTSEKTDRPLVSALVYTFGNKTAKVQYVAIAYTLSVSSSANSDASNTLMGVAAYHGKNGSNESEIPAYYGIDGSGSGDPKPWGTTYTVPGATTVVSKKGSVASASTTGVYYVALDASANTHITFVWGRSKAGKTNTNHNYSVTIDSIDVLEGEGTEDSPLLLQDRTDFDIVSGVTNSGTNFSGKYFKVQPDKSVSGQTDGKTIDMGSSSFTPIGNVTNKFSGIVDGNSCTVKNIKVSVANYAGLFGYTSGATISNLSVSGYAVASSEYAGLLVGYMDGGTISGTTNASLTNHNSDDDGVSGTYSGGLVGYNKGGTISGTVTISGSDVDYNGVKCSYVGGAVGYNTGTISATVTVSVRVLGRNGGQYIGGVVGYNTGTLSGSLTKSSGDVLGVGQGDYVGGIVGYNSGTMSGTFNHSSQHVAYKSATVYGGQYVGGIVGKNESGATLNLASEYTNNSAIVGTNYVGGIAGYIFGKNNDNPLVFDSLSNANAVTASGSYVGGLFGVAKYVTINTKATNSGAVTGISYVGGIIGEAQGSGSEHVVLHNASNSGTITSKATAGSDGLISALCVGGILGRGQDTQLNGTISNTGKISAQYANCVGGIYGYLYGSGMQGSTTMSNTAEILGNYYVGGLVGRMQWGTLQNEVSNSGSVTGYKYVAGIVGAFGLDEDKEVSTTTPNSTFAVTKATNSGNILCYGDYTGGIIGGGAIRGSYRIASSGLISNTSPITASGNYVGGLFGYIYVTEETTTSIVAEASNSATVQSTGGGYVGGIVGQVESSAFYRLTISKSTNTGTVKGSTTIGGIAGKMQNATLAGEVTNGASGTNSTVVGSGDNVGGIVGHLYGGTISATSITNYMAVSGASYVGGVIGKYELSGMSASGNITNNGTISGSGTDGVGGIVGGLASGSSASLTKCINNGSVTANSANGVGGIIGRTESSTTGTLSVSASKNTNAITGKVNVGGIGGRMETTNTAENSLTFTNCYNSGNISAASGGQNTIGGIVGYLCGNSTGSRVARIAYCYSSGNVSSSDSKRYGAIVGNAVYSKSGSTATTVVEYCYTTKNIPISNGDVDGLDFNLAPISNTNYIIISGTSAPSVGVGGSYLVYNGTNGPKPAEGDTVREWTDITSRNINALIVTASMSNGKFFESKQGVGGSYLAPNAYSSNYSSSESFTVTARYNASEGKNVYCAVANINVTIPTNHVYDGNTRGVSVSNPTTTGNVYTISISYGDNITPKNAGTYNVTVIVKIGDKVVGKKTGDTYSIAKKGLSITPTWSTHTSDTGETRNYTYNNTKQGVLSFVVNGFIGSESDEVTHSGLTYSRSGNTYTLANGQCVNANSNYYSVTISLNNSTNYTLTSKTYQWKINQFNLSSADVNHVMFAGNETLGLIMGNTAQLSWNGSALFRLDNALIYTADSRYTASNFVVSVKYNNGQYGTLVLNADYTLSELTKASGDPTDVKLTASAKSGGNYTGSIEKKFTAMISDFGGNYNQANWGGSGNKFLISHPAHLIRLSEIVNGTTQAWNSIYANDTNLCLTKNSDYVAKNITSRTFQNAYFQIAMTEGKTNLYMVNTEEKQFNFTPIGKDTSHPFSGNFDGQNKPITNLKIEWPDNDYVGLFGFVQGGTRASANSAVVSIGASIKNVTISGTITGKNYVGGIVGHASSTPIENCKNNASVTGVNYVGGIAGMGGNTVGPSGKAESGWGFNAKTLSNTGSITGTGNYVAGLIGFARDVMFSGTISNSGVIEGKSYTGGLVGILNGGSLSTVSNSGNVTGASFVGGITGQINWGKLENATNSGIIIGSGDYVGGIAGSLTKSNKDDASYIKGTLTNSGCVKGLKYVGGIIGDISYTGQALTDRTDEFAWTATVSTSGTALGDGDGVRGQQYVGGAIGHLSGAVTIKGTITVSGNDVDSYGLTDVQYMGGLIGHNEGVLTGTGTVAVRVIGRAGGSYIGGIVGNNTGTISGTYTKTVKDVLSVGAGSYVGGICGSSTGVINGAYAYNGATTDSSFGTVYGGTYVGAFFGRLDLQNIKDTDIKISFNDSDDQSSYLRLSIANPIEVKGKNCVGYLFGMLIGNGYHASASEAKETKLCVSNTFSGTVKGANGGAVLGGLVGFMSKSAMIFSTEWNTNNITFGSLTNMSFVGGIIGMLGENGTIESAVTYDDKGAFVTGGIHTIEANTTFGATDARLGNFVGGIVGYVTSSAGTYYGDKANVLGNTVALKSTGSIFAGSYVGGIFGAVGDFDETTSTSLANNYDISSYLVKLLNTGNFAGQRSGNTLTINPNATDVWHSVAGGKLTTNVDYILGDSYVGGLIGYVDSNSTITLENSTLDSNNIENLSIYVITTNYKGIVGTGSCIGGLIGYLSNGEHTFKNIVVRAFMGSVFNADTCKLDAAPDNLTAQYVGGIVGYMMNGTIDGCIAMQQGDTLTASTNAWKGAQYVGGLVGYTSTATIRNSYTTGFKLAYTTNTRGGVVGFAISATIENSWAFYVAEHVEKATAFDNNGNVTSSVTESATYSLVSKSSYGKYIAVDDSVDIPLTYPILVGFVTSDSFEFTVKVPNANITVNTTTKKDDNNYKTSTLANKQLVFYDASGSDSVTNNTSAFTTFTQSGNVLTMALNKATGKSMQVYVVDIKFVDVPQYSGTDETTKRSTAQGAYRHPSSSENYEADVTGATFNSNGYITNITANIYFNPTGKGSVLIGTANKELNRVSGLYNQSFTPGSEEAPITISSLTEWNAWATDSAKDSTDYVSLIANIDATNQEIKWATGFKGTFNGNGHWINIGTKTGAGDGTSLFPSANGATFKNLTIKGSISGSGNGIAGIVGVAGGSLTFENCTNQVNITSSGKNVGGILGQTHTAKAEYNFTDCVNEGALKNTVNSNVTGMGGIIGNAITDKGADVSVSYGNYDEGNKLATITIESCRNAGNLNGTFNIGGIIGRNGGTATIKNSGNTGTITAYGENVENDDFKATPIQVNKMDTNVGGIGGLVTYNASINVYASYNSGDILGWGNKAGGILAADCEYNESESTTHIYYCYNTGNITTGGNKEIGKNNDDESSGCIAGGIAGAISNADIQYCYNTGKITTNGWAYKKAWFVGLQRQARCGGIVGFVDSSEAKTISNCYSIGIIRTGFETGGNKLGAAPIVGGSSGDGATNSVTTSKNYSLHKLVSIYGSSENDDLNAGDSDYYHTGTLFDDVSSLTAYMNSNGNLEMSEFDISQNLTALTKTEYNEDGTTNTSSGTGIAGTSGGYIYVYGCLPQLAVFAVDTQNGLAMTSVAYGKDQYGTYTLQQAGGEYNPFVIKDGIDLLGLRSLVRKNYDFYGKYIEFANSENNLEKVQANNINFAAVSGALTDANNAYTAHDGTTDKYIKGSSYHLLDLGATYKAFDKWKSNNYYYNATTGSWTAGATFENQNMLAIGDDLNAQFRGHISGKQTSGTNTTLTHMRIANSYASLFSTVEDGYVGYIGIANTTISSRGVAGGIVARPRGTATIEGCTVSSSTIRTFNNTAVDYSNAVGGIAGYAHTYSRRIAKFDQGATVTIKNCTVDADTQIIGYQQYIGGILGNIYNDEKARSANTMVLVDGCSVNSATIVAKTNNDVINTNGQYIGGILGYGSQDILGAVNNCRVGTSSGSVEISGYTQIGGIVGAMTNVQGGYIKDCTVGANATIKATAECTNIGGIVGSTDAGASVDDVTMSFQGTNTFGGRIDLNHKKAENIGGVIGTMNRGANFLTGAVINVNTNSNGNIVNPGEKSANIGGVAGLTNDATFSGTFTVAPKMDTGIVDNVGGFIGKNSGETHILSEGTEITISGSISGATEVGGFIGVNDSGAELVIGIDMYHAKPYMGALSITISATISAGTDNAGGIVGKNEGSLSIVKGTISTTANSSVSGRNNIGGIVGLNDGSLATGGSNSTTVSLEINNGGSVSGVESVGGVFGRLNAGKISGTFGNSGDVAGTTQYVGGSIGFVASGVEINDATMTNSGNVKGVTVSGEGENKTESITASCVGGSIGVLYGSITGGSFVNSGQVTGVSYVGGSIGALEGSISGGTYSNTKEVSGANYVGGSIGHATRNSAIANATMTNSGTITGSADYVGGSIGGLDGNINNGTYTNIGSVTGRYFVGGVIGRFNQGTITGVFGNEGTISGDSYAGGAIGYVAQGATISHPGKFTNSGEVNATNYFAGGSIGILYGSIVGTSTDQVKFLTQTAGDKEASISAQGYVGGSIGVIAGKVNYAQFVNNATLNVSNAQIAIGGSVGFVGLPDTSYIVSDNLDINAVDNNYVIVSGITSNYGNYIFIQYTHFEAKGNLNVQKGDGASTQDDSVDKTTSGGVGGAIGVIGGSGNKFTKDQWNNNTYYAMANVSAPNVDNVGGVFGLIRATGFEISNMLAYNTVVTGHDNVGGIVGAVGKDITGVKILQCFALDGKFSGNSNVGGIVGLAQGDTDASSSYWMLGLENSTLAGSNLENLSKNLGFTGSGDGTTFTTAPEEGHIYTTGDSKHGWYFLYANNANGGYSGIGTIDVAHNSDSDDENLKYWKRIADAYSSTERASGANTEPLNQSALTQNKQVTKGYVYATATAAPVANGGDGYYLYTTTSKGNSDITHYTTTDNKDAFYININTTDNLNADGKFDENDYVGNFAVYYRMITSGSAPTYNGYQRVGVVGMDGVTIYSGKDDIQNHPFADADKEKYYFTTDTKVAVYDETGTIITGYIESSESMTNAGSYTSNIRIYYVDKGGTVYAVGGNQAMTWTIKARELSITLNDGNKVTNRWYGQEWLSDGSFAYDMKFEISNIAPGQYDKEICTITVNGVVFTVEINPDGTSATVKTSGDSNGIKVEATVMTAQSEIPADKTYVADGIDTSKGFYAKTLICYLTFTIATTYDVTIDMSTAETTAKNYTPAQSKFTYGVNERTLTISPDTWTSGQTSTSPYTYKYNTRFQGLEKVTVDSGDNQGTTGMVNNDKITLNVTVTWKSLKGETGSATGKVESFSSSAPGSIKSIVEKLEKVGFVGTYTVKYEIGEDGKGKYKLDNTSHTWTITKHVVSVSGFSNLGSEKIYDGIAVVPELDITGDNGNGNGTYTYEGDTFTVTYQVNGKAQDKLVNAGEYNIKIGSGNGSIKANRTNKTTLDTSENYDFGGSAQTITYKIKAREVTLSWEPTKSFVFTDSPQGLKVNGASSDVLTYTVSETSSLTSAILLVKNGSTEIDKITVNYSGAQTNVCTEKMSYSSHTVDPSYKHGTSDGSINANYTFTNTESGSYSIVASKLKISSASASGISKVYDGGASVNMGTNGKISWNITRADGNTTGKVPVSSEDTNSYTYFKVDSKVYTNTNVGSSIKISVTIKFVSTDKNYSGSTYTANIDSGEITPKQAYIVLDKLRNNKATKVYDGDSTYAGSVSGNGSTGSRLGEGFSVSGLLDNNVEVSANYAEAGDDRSFFDSYVNGVYQDAENKYQQDKSGSMKLYKKLVFKIKGTSAGNYMFNVYNNDTGKTAYCEKSIQGISSKDQYVTLTVYDSRDEHKYTSQPTINIEITMSAVKVSYSGTYQSYVDDNGGYRINAEGNGTAWDRVTGTISGVSDKDIVKVHNYWMYADGIDDGLDEGYKQYTSYTVITGNKNSKLLYAEINPEKGMNFNYSLSNQPTLTIAYIVTDKGEFKIDSMADLLIASFYYSASQNPDNALFAQIVQSGSELELVATNEEYLNDIAKWEEEFANKANEGKIVFQSDDNNWYCYISNSAGSYKAIPTSFLLTKDLNGVLSETDIETLKAFFTVAKSDDNGNITTSTSYGWGYGKDYLKNVLTTKVGSVVTVLGSLFVTDSGTGFSGSFDGNGYVIEYLNIMGYGYGNVGLFDVIDNGVVRNLHLRNVSINANKGNVGGIAGEIKTGNDAVSNVSFHGSINISGSDEVNVGGLFGTSAREISNAIVLGTINSSNSSAVVGGVVGSSSASISKVVSMMQITTNGANTGAFVGKGTSATESYHMANAIYNGKEFVNDSAVSYSALMDGSKTGYGDSKYYYEDGKTASVKGTYDVLDDYAYVNKDSLDNAKQSMRLIDIVKVYLLMYSLTETTDTIKVYAISDSSWLVGDKLGTVSSPIVIANKQNVSLLRELRFATFTLASNIDIEISSTFSGTFYGTVNIPEDTEYKISCNKPMFAVYCNNESSWLTLKEN